jgi:hypothetical protein
LSSETWLLLVSCLVLRAVFLVVALDLASLASWVLPVLVPLLPPPVLWLLPTSSSLPGSDELPLELLLLLLLPLLVVVSSTIKAASCAMLMMGTPFRLRSRLRLLAPKSDAYPSWAADPGSSSDSTMTCHPRQGME